MSEEYITKDYTKNGGAQELINDLVDGKIKFSEDKTEDLDINGFSGLSLDGFARRTSEMWQWLLEHMHNTHTISSEDGRYGIREEDFPDDILSDGTKLTSVVEFINENSDLSDQLLIKYITDVVKTKADDKYWNESVAQLIDYFYHQFQDDDGEIDHSKIKIGDVKNADAGNNFTDDNGIINVAKWVIPWNNICNESYEQVRSNDKIVRVIKDAAKLQFTKKKNNKPSETEEGYSVKQGTKTIAEGKDIAVYDYLRLLMPEYPRVIEVEDLNRNFWVIGQVLTALCAFLFDDDGPLKNMFDGILDEICQLWENVFYLWLSAIQETKENYTTIQGVFLPVTPYENYPYLKYDNFYRTDLSIAGIKEAYSTVDAEEALRDYYKQYLNYFKDLYKGTAICVVPEIRQINYAENYYAKATYLGFIIYDESIEGDNKVQYNVFDYPITIDLTEQTYTTESGEKKFNNSPWSIHENETSYYIAGSVNDQISDGATPYQQLIQPKFSLTWDSTNKQSGIWNGLTCTLSFIDKVHYIYDGTEDGIIYQWELSEGTYKMTIKDEGQQGSKYFAGGVPEENQIKKEKGFYRGELISWYNIKYMKLQDKAFVLMPLNIGTMLSGNIPNDLMYTEHPFIDDDWTKDLSEEEIKAQDEAFIKIITNNPQNVGIEENSFSLVTLERNKGLELRSQEKNFSFTDARGDSKTSYSKEIEVSGYIGSGTERQTRAYIIHPKLGYQQEFPNYPYLADNGSWNYKIHNEADNYDHKVIGDYLADGDKHYASTHKIQKAEFYLKNGDKGVKRDNWIIRYTSVYGTGFIKYEESTSDKYKRYYSNLDTFKKMGICNEDGEIIEGKKEELKTKIQQLYKVVNEYDGTQSYNEQSSAPYYRNGGLSAHMVSTLFFPNGDMYQFEVKRKNREGQEDGGPYLMMCQLGDSVQNMFEVPESSTKKKDAYAAVDPDNKEGENGNKYSPMEEYPLRYHIWPRLGTKQSQSGISAGTEQQLFDYVEVNEDE